MTYRHKLARRLALLRGVSFLTVLAACKAAGPTSPNVIGDPLAPPPAPGPGPAPGPAQPVLSRVVLLPDSFSVTSGDSTVVRVVALSAAGDTLTATVRCRSTHVTVRDSSAGRDRFCVVGGGAALGAGTFTADARALATGGTVPTGDSVRVTGQVLVTARPQAGLAPIAQVPIAPESVPDVAWRAPTGRTITVSAGGDLQAALNDARSGDEVVLAAGATFIGNFALPNRGDNGWVVVRSAGTLPPGGTRITPATASGFAKIGTHNTLAAITATGGSRGWRLVGLEIMAPPSTQLNYGLVNLGTAEETTLAALPRDIILDRVYIHGHPTGEIRRGVALNGAHLAVIDSWISEIHMTGFDTQALMGWNGPGPFLIQNNYLEAAAENILFGGADPRIPNLVPSDITVRRNHLFKPMSWQQSPWMTKNLFQLKNAQRVLVEDNVMENNWAGAQPGFAVVLTPVNQDGGCTWCVVQDVSFRYNIIRNAGSGFNVTQSSWGVTASGKRISIRQTLLENIGAPGLGGGRMLYVQRAVDDVTFEHNTAMYAVTNATTMASINLMAPGGARLTIRNNIIDYAQYGLGLDACCGGTAALNGYSSDWTFRGNILIAPFRPDLYPSDNSYPASRDAVGFASVASGDWRLRSDSPLRQAGVQGLTPGVDHATLRARLQGVAAP